MVDPGLCSEVLLESAEEPRCQSLERGDTGNDCYLGEGTVEATDQREIAQPVKGAENTLKALKPDF